MFAPGVIQEAYGKGAIPDVHVTDQAGRVLYLESDKLSPQENLRKSRLVP